MALEEVYYNFVVVDRFLDPPFFMQKEAIAYHFHTVLFHTYCLHA